MVEYDLRMLCQ